MTGGTVEVDSSGQLGVVLSSVRYKRDIHHMGTASANLMQLRPVTFIYKNDPSNTRQYGLVAEQVREIYPELVTYDDQGKLQSVRYEQLIPMLLNELQKQANQVQTQTRETEELTQRLQAKDAQLAAQQREIDALKQQNVSINALSERLATLERQVQTANSERLRSLASK